MTPIVVYTTGRTGSMLICQNLSQYFETKTTSERDTVHSNVIHCHNPLWQPTVDTPATCVLSKRRDLFSLIMSTLVGRRTNEFANYSNKTVVPFDISLLEFTGCYWFAKCFYHVIDVGNFSQVIEIYYEDLMSDTAHLFSKFNIDRATDYNLSKKTPYGYRDLVTNLPELHELYQQLDSQPVTQDLITSLKKNISSDLEQMYIQAQYRLAASSSL